MYNASSTNSAKCIAEWEGHTGESNELIELVVLIKRFLDHWNHDILNLNNRGFATHFNICIILFNVSRNPEVPREHGNTTGTREHARSGDLHDGVIESADQCGDACVLCLEQKVAHLKWHGQIRWISQCPTPDVMAFPLMIVQMSGSPGASSSLSRFMDIASPYHALSRFVTLCHAMVRRNEEPCWRLWGSGRRRRKKEEGRRKKKEEGDLILPERRLRYLISINLSAHIRSTSPEPGMHGCKLLSVV